MEFCPTDSFCQGRVYSYPVGKNDLAPPKAMDWSIELWFKAGQASLCGTPPATGTFGPYRVTMSSVCRLWTTWDYGTEVDMTTSGAIEAGYIYANVQPNITTCSQSSTNVPVLLASPDTYADPNWHYLVFEHDTQIGYDNLYVDGQLKTQKVIPMLFGKYVSPCFTATSPASLAIGNNADQDTGPYYYHNAASPFYGSLSEVAFYQSSLSLQQIDAHFATAQAFTIKQMQAGALYSVSCASSSFCVAVGNSGNSPLIETESSGNLSGPWVTYADPSTWAGSGRLTSVSCMTLSTSTAQYFCMAVGNIGISGGTERYYIDTTVPGGGTPTWSDPVIMGSGLSQFFGVSCSSPPPTSNLPNPPNYCVAVGDVLNGQDIDGVPLVETWQNQTWTVVPFSTLGSVLGYSLNGVSCPASGLSCVISGYSYPPTEPVAGTLTLPSVSTPPAVAQEVPTGEPTPVQAFYGITCAPTLACTSVGVQEVSGTLQTLAETYSPQSGSFVVQTPTNQDASGVSSSQTTNYLYGVSCPAAGPCFAVGDYYASGGPASTLIESYRPALGWTIVSSQDPTGSSALGTPLSDYLASVACVSLGCVVVGRSTTTQGGENALIETDT
ncbi:MAG TPA: hypothetical protein VKR22_08110 [Acidimicrobiales bacterium]|nr:hypothetical protein [Acidimicrobiales bacterium]